MEDKNYEVEVAPETPFPGEPIILPTQVQPSQGGNYSPTTAKEQSFKKKRTAVELLSTALNTKSRKILQEFALQDSGSIKIGNFKEGLSGDLRLTPNGLTARNISGITTFAIDGDTGDAVFKGEIRSGSLITGSIISGDVSLGGSTNGDGTLSAYTASGDKYIELDNAALTAYLTNGDKYFVLDNGALYFYGDSSQTRAEVKFDPTENFLYTRVIQVGGNYGGTPSQDGQIVVNDSADATQMVVDTEGLTMRDGNFLSIEGLATPNAPSVANGVRLYLDTSGGKTRLMALFESGAAQVVATEP